MRGSFISACRMTDGSLPTGRRSCERRRLMLAIPSAYRPASRRPFSRAGSPAMPSLATRQTGADLPASRISSLRSALNTKATMASVGRRRRSVSSAAARTAICRTSTGVASSTRTFAAKAQPEPPAPAGNRCGWKMRVRAPIRAIPASSATAAHPCRWRNCFSPAVSAHVLASDPGSATGIRRRAMHLTGFACSPEARPTPTSRRSPAWSRCRKRSTSWPDASRRSGRCWRGAHRSTTFVRRVASIRR